jgi:hypothetical protein
MTSPVSAGRPVTTLNAAPAANNNTNTALGQAGSAVPSGAAGASGASGAMDQFSFAWIATPFGPRPVAVPNRPATGQSFNQAGSQSQGLPAHLNGALNGTSPFANLPRPGGFTGLGMLGGSLGTSAGQNAGATPATPQSPSNGTGAAGPNQTANQPRPLPPEIEKLVKDKKLDEADAKRLADLAMKRPNWALQYIDQVTDSAASNKSLLDVVLFEADKSFFSQPISVILGLPKYGYPNGAAAQKGAIKLYETDKDFLEFSLRVAKPMSEREAWAYLISCFKPSAPATPSTPATSPSTGASGTGSPNVNVNVTLTPTFYINGSPATPAAAGANVVTAPAASSPQTGSGAAPTGKPTVSSPASSSPAQSITPSSTLASQPAVLTMPNAQSSFTAPVALNHSSPRRM